MGAILPILSSLPGIIQAVEGLFPRTTDTAATVPASVPRGPEKLHAVIAIATAVLGLTSLSADQQRALSALIEALVGVFNSFGVFDQTMRRLR